LGGEGYTIYIISKALNEYEEGEFMRIKKVESLTLSIALFIMLIISQMPIRSVAEVKQTKGDIKTAEKLEYSEDSIIVKFKKGVSEKEKESVKKAAEHR